PSKTLPAPLALQPSGGNVGIGTAGPTAGLTIDKGKADDLALLLTSSGKDWGSGLQMKNTGPNGNTYGIYSGEGKLHFMDVDKGVDRLIIDNVGNVWTAGLMIDKGASTDPALLLTSSASGWGCGLEIGNTAQGGRTYGIYSGAGELRV